MPFLLLAVIIICQFRAGRAVAFYVQHLVEEHQPSQQHGLLAFEEGDFLRFVTERFGKGALSEFSQLLRQERQYRLAFINEYLPKAIDREILKHDKRDIKRQLASLRLIAEAMKTLGYVNRFSRGVNMVQEALAANKSKAAVFLLDDITTFKVVVYNADVTNDVTNDVTDRQNKIIELIKRDKRVSTAKMAEACQVNKRTILRDIEKLKDKYIRYVGDRNVGYWEIIPKK